MFVLHYQNRLSKQRVNEAYRENKCFDACKESKHLHTTKFIVTLTKYFITYKYKLFSELHTTQMKRTCYSGQCVGLLRRRQWFDSHRRLSGCIALDVFENQRTVFVPIHTSPSLLRRLEPDLYCKCNIPVTESMHSHVGIHSEVANVRGTGRALEEEDTIQINCDS